MKTESRIIYTIVFIGDRELSYDNLGNSLIASCTTRVALSLLSGINKDRLDYVFGRLKRDYLSEGGCIIFCSRTLYVSNHPGGSGDTRNLFSRIGRFPGAVTDNI